MKRLVLALLLWPAVAVAHPMGNFSVGQHATLELARGNLSVRYVLDLAEVPTYQLRAAMFLEPAAAITQADVELLREKSAREWLGKLAVTLDGRPLALEAVSGRSALTPGAGGLPTVRFEIEARAAWEPTSGTPHALGYRDANFPDRVGWKEVVVRAADGVTLASATAPSVDRTSALTKYPDQAAAAPLSVREANATFAVAAAAPAVGAPVQAAGTTAPGTSASDLQHAILLILAYTLVLAAIAYAATRA